jgi:hypothetical protein
MSDFKSPAGSFAKGTGRDPKSSGKPSAGITNESHGKANDFGPGQGHGRNNSRIK